MASWISSVQQWLCGERRRRAIETEPNTVTDEPSFETALERCQQALDELKLDDGDTLLPVLVARGQVEEIFRKADSVPSDQLQQLIALDAQLRRCAKKALLADLPTWRQTARPPESHWWWFLDQETEKDLLWILLTGTFTMLTVPFLTEIIKRLWSGAPDGLSVFGTLLTLLLTSSPLIKQGRELVKRILSWTGQFIPFLRRRYHAEVVAGMTMLVFVLVLIGRLLLPQLAIYYNNLGHDSLQAGNLTAARRAFQRAVALDLEHTEGYYHLGVVYEEIGRPDDAIAWYQRALEHNLDLGVAYNNLGRLYILQGKYSQAIQLLQAGVRRTVSDTLLERVTRYTLHKNLGWAYYAQEQYQQARTELEQSLMLERELNTAQKSAAPHYYLALVYEALEMPAEAVEQWEDCLRYIVDGEPDQNGWNRTALAHLEKLAGESQ